MDIPSSVDVLVVGAGPTGLMLAVQLARRGVRPLIIDRSDGPSVKTKALGVHARTLEIYDRLGIAREAVDLGKRATGATMWAGGRIAAHVPLGDIGAGLSPFPYVLILGQDDNERLLGELLHREGVAVRWGTELTALGQSADAVRATLRTADGRGAEVRAAWVAGCDGPRSAVREQNGIGFAGAPYEEVFFVADTTATGPMTPGEVNVFLRPGGFHLFFPMRGEDHWRIVGILPPELRGRDDLEFGDVAPSVRAETGPAFALRSCGWFSTYRIHHRRAGRFREGRCFLLGDAAHIHSPVGAQGMNTGLQDAYNLAWKLAPVARGRADPALLDTYAAEREPVADRLLRTTDRAFSLVVSRGRLARTLRTEVLPRVLALAMGRASVRTLAFRTISQIGIRYPRSRLSVALPDLPGGGPRPGDRLPWLRLRLTPGGPIEDVFGRLDDTRFTLVVIGQDPAGVTPRGDLALLGPVRADPDNDRELGLHRVPAPSFYLLRPDGHIGLAGGTLDPAAIEDYLAGVVGLRTPGAPARTI